MCIRDRGVELGDHLRPGDALSEVSRGGDDDVLRVDPLPVAVSYTHLRAHETVLDLVCRLLLEKKKNV